MKYSHTVFVLQRASFQIIPQTAVKENWGQNFTLEIFRKKCNHLSFSSRIKLIRLRGDSEPVIVDMFVHVHHRPSGKLLWKMKPQQNSMPAEGALATSRPTSALSPIFHNMPPLQDIQRSTLTLHKECGSFAVVNGSFGGGCQSIADMFPRI